MLGWEAGITVWYCVNRLYALERYSEKARISGYCCYTLKAARTAG